MKKTKPPRVKDSVKMRLFQAEADYADSIVRSALGDQEGSLAALKRALEWDPTYAPAILTLGSIEYQRRRRAQGRKLFQSLVSLPETTPDLFEIIDEAATFLVDFRAYQDGLALFRAAAERFPSVAAFHEGVCWAASKLRLYDQALAAAERSLQLEPGTQKYVNNLGWALFEAGRLEQAQTELERAVSMDPADELARENLRLCRAEIAKRSEESGATLNPPPVRPRRRPKSAQSSRIRDGKVRI